MNAIIGIAEDAADEMRSNASAPRLYTLRRSGRKAVRFSGWQLVEAVGTGDTGTMWYDLAIYRSDSDAIIVELVARRRPLDEQDLCRVEVFLNLSAASCWLETYQCGNDVPIPASLSENDAPMATMVLKAIQLRQRIARISDEYHCLLSDVFDALDITDNPLPAGAAQAGGQSSTLACAHETS